MPYSDSPTSAAYAQKASCAAARLALDPKAQQQHQREWGEEQQPGPRRPCQRCINTARSPVTRHKSGYCQTCGHIVVHPKQIAAPAAVGSAARVGDIVVRM